jgi:hypothetical protein
LSSKDYVLMLVMGLVVHELTGAHSSPICYVEQNRFDINFNLRSPIKEFDFTIMEMSTNEVFVVNLIKLDLLLTGRNQLCAS